MDYHVIDADGHICEPPDLWERYIEPKYREGCPKLITREGGEEILRIEGDYAISLSRGKQKVSFGGVGAIGARDGKVSSKIPYAEGRKGGFDPHARIPDMDAEGIDAAFLYPSLGLFMGATKDPDFSAAVCRAYNRWLADYCKPYPARLFGAAMLRCSRWRARCRRCASRPGSWTFTRASSAPIPTTAASCMIRNTIRCGPKPRNSASQSGFMVAPRAASQHSQWIALRAGWRCGTWSRIPSR